MSMMIALIISAVVAAAASTIVGGVTAGVNAESVKETNEANLQAVRETNASNVEQAELAYRRSLPTAQIRNLMDAGMSRPAALATLTGGGTYQAPVLQSAKADAPQMDLTGVSSAFERLGNIPSDVEQYNLVEQQRNSLAIDTQNKINEEKRRQDMHNFDLWQRQYGKDNATALDAARSKTVQAILDSGKEIKDFNSFEDMLRQLGLDRDALIRNMPSIARSQFEESVRNSFAEARAQQQQINANQEQYNRNVAAKDSHIKAIDDLKNSEFGRTLTAKQIAKLEADTANVWNEVDAYDKSQDARDAENALRVSRATFERMLNDFNISKEQLRESLYLDSNGKPNLKAGVSTGISEAWRFAGSIFGVDYLADIVRGLITIAPKP